MNCYECNKPFTKKCLKCGYTINKNGYKTVMLCTDCHTDKLDSLDFDNRGLEDLLAAANECKSIEQLNGAWRGSIFPNRWKRKGYDDYYNRALAAFKKRKACFEK